MCDIDYSDSGNDNGNNSLTNHYDLWKVFNASVQLNFFEIMNKTMIYFSPIKSLAIEIISRSQPDVLLRR